MKYNLLFIEIKILQKIFVRSISYYKNLQPLLIVIFIGGTLKKNLIIIEMVNL